MDDVVRVRAIHYETVARDLFDGLGLSPGELKSLIPDCHEVAVLTCVDRHGHKLTAVGDPDDLRRMLTKDRDRSNDLELLQARWPVLLRGWLQAS